MFVLAICCALSLIGGFSFSDKRTSASFSWPHISFHLAVHVMEALLSTLMCSSKTKVRLSKTFCPGEKKEVMHTHTFPIM